MGHDDFNGSDRFVPKFLVYFPPTACEQTSSPSILPRKLEISAHNVQPRDGIKAVRLRSKTALIGFGCLWCPPGKFFMAMLAQTWGIALESIRRVRS